MIEVDEWVPADDLTLEPNALRAATETEQCTALSAGPGAGKTEVLAQRADFLLRTNTCPYPKRILAISFKVDASKNLKERVKIRCGHQLASRFDSHTFHGFAKIIIDRFRPELPEDDRPDAGYTVGERRIGKSQIEYSDLLPLACQVLENSQLARNAIRKTYSDVFLDEFQDCTEEQYRLISLAFLGTGIRLTAVGDSKQRIMGWAGAVEGIFERFIQDFNARSLAMYLNFRSSPQLLRVQNEIVKVLDPESAMEDTVIHGDEGEVFVSGFESDNDEAGAIANRIEHWIQNENVPLSEIAVLVSKQVASYAEKLMDELKNRNIPFRNEQILQDISSEPLMRLIKDYLSCLYGKGESSSWIRVIGLLSEFDQYDKEETTSRELALFIREHELIINQERAQGQLYQSWKSIIDEFIDYIGLEKLADLSSDYESSERIGEVINNTKDRIEELLESEEDLLVALQNLSDEEAIRILTIHKSKGLEFEKVIIMAVEEQIFFGDANEERCSFFVGVSRAKKELLLTYAERRTRPTGHSGWWDVGRTPQAEYIGYCRPYAN